MTSSDTGSHPRPSRRRFSLAGRLSCAVVVALVLLAGLTWAGSLLSLPSWLVSLLSFGLTLPVALWAVHRALHPLQSTLEALSDGIRSFRDGDFSVRLTTRNKGELSDLVQLYNRVGEILHEERSQIRRRELLLETALSQSPVAIVLVNYLDRVIYANQEARQLFLGGDKLEGRRFGEILEQCPAEMRQVLERESDGIFSIDTGDESEIYHLAQRGFHLNRLPHVLYLLRRMTPELSRKEAEIWKKVIRIISHELNNSLAPISSLAHSGLRIAEQPDQLHKLEPVYAAIRERIDHLTRFLEGYARFARLPRPRRRKTTWQEILDGPSKLYSFELLGELPTSPVTFDPSQLEQVLINLLKNAAEASDGTPEISVSVDRLPDGSSLVQVLDRGRGMSEEVMRQALLPFYSTKQTGSGVGLPLCREIIEAHGGTLRIQSREGGGTTVSFRLPPGPE